MFNLIAMPLWLDIHIDWTLLNIVDTDSEVVIGGVVCDNAETLGHNVLTTRYCPMKGKLFVYPHSSFTFIHLSSF